jgi:zinc transport system ATP-binding protein
MEKEAVVEVSGLHVRLAGREVLERISFKVKKGEILAIIGPNGAGKSVLLQTILGMHPYRGKISYDHGLKIGYLPQNINLNPYLRLTVGELFEIKRKMLGLPRSNVHEAIRELGLEGAILSKQLTALSGGYMQKVLLVLALIGDSDIIILDEPTAHIDLAGEKEIHKSLHRLMKMKKTVILASHDLHMINEHADRVLGINKKEVCFGETQKILTTDVLRKLFGEHHKRHHLAKHRGAV